MEGEKEKKRNGEIGDIWRWKEREGRGRREGQEMERGTEAVKECERVVQKG